MVRRCLAAILLVLMIAPLSSSFTAGAHAQPTSVHVAGHVQRPAAFLDKTRVVLHLAIAYGVFHHWVWNPFRAHQLSVHHPIKLIKAGAALLFAVHEVKVATNITSHSSDPTLKKLNGVLTDISNKFQNVGTLFHDNPQKLTDGQVASSVSDLNKSVDSSNQILKVPDAPVSQLPSF
ncbi:MAG: hypothetical protein JWO42_1176 [Chloroflexi bacterium]|jgi:hypothetical protein|nr:hypothetical protein [Chloroflexota bacterium]